MDWKKSLRHFKRYGKYSRVSALAAARLPKPWGAIPMALVALLTFPARTSNGCGFWEGPDYLSGFHFLKTEALLPEASEYSPYILRFEDYFLTDSEARKTQRIANLQEWSDNACETDRLKDIDEVVYTSSASDLESLRAYAAKGGPVPSRWRDNPFAAGLVKSKCTETFDYLIYAKYCEPHAIAGSAWEEDPEFDADVQQLIDLGKTRMMKTDNHFLRLRYMYQIVRLAHYSDQYEYALELYEDLDYKVDEVESLINWWLLGHKAGCLKRLGRNAEAAYLFSKVFRNCPSKREQVFRSFTIRSDEEWEELLDYCHSNEERSTLFAMRAMDDNSKIVEEMRNIYFIEPQSEFLTPMLLEEIANIESVFLGAEFKRGRQDKMSDGVAKKKLLPLLQFVIRALEEGKVRDKNTWMLAQGYLEYLSRDLYAANTTYKKLRKDLAEGTPLWTQLEVLQLILNIHAYTEITPEVEEELAQFIHFNPYFKEDAQLAQFLFERVSHLYQQQGDEGKAFLCNFQMENLRHNPKKEEINDLIALAEMNKKNNFEEYLLENRIGPDYLSQLYEIKGTYHLSRYELSEALRAFRKVLPDLMQKETFYPFHIGINDCIHCEFGQDTLDMEVTKLGLTDTLIEYEYLAKTDLDNAALYYLKLGAAYYNMSYYGHEYDLIDYYRTHDAWAISKEGMEARIEQDKSWGGFGNREFTDVSKALFFFDQAKEHAKDDEMAAKASFMAAKCELAAYYQDPETDYKPWRNDVPELPEKYRNYYDLLIKKYSGTAFFQQAVEECKFFGLYVEKSSRR